MAAAAFLARPITRGAPGEKAVTLLTRSVLAVHSSQSRLAASTATGSRSPIGSHRDDARRAKRYTGLRPHKSHRWQDCQRSAAPGFFELQQQQRRYFFSFFRGDNNDNADEKEEDPEIDLQTQDHFPNEAQTKTNNSNFNPNTDIDRNWEDRYRRPVTRELWNEFRKEGQRTRDYLSAPPHTDSPSSHHRARSPGYHKIAQEMQSSINEVWADPNASAPPEYGPTGKWTYRFETSDIGNRLYERKRCSNAAVDVASSSGLPEVVLGLPPEAEILAMSLTPDEACVACLLQIQPQLQTETTGGKIPPVPGVKLRSVESGNERVLTDADFRVDAIAEGPSDLVSLEWGPILNRDNNSASFRYSLYLLLADHQGRPDRVVLCQIDPSTLKLAVPPLLIYKSDDPAFMIDVQRTKGCSCVAIRALSKTSSEVFLSPPPGQGIDNGEDSSELITVRPKQDNVVYHVDMGPEGDVVLLTSDEKRFGGDYFLEETSISALPLAIPTSLTTSLSTPTSSSLPLPIDGNHPEFFVEDMDLFRTHIVLYERSRITGDQRVKVRQRNASHHDGRTPNEDPQDLILDLSSSSGKNQSRNNDTGEQLRLPLYWSKLTPVGNMCFEASFFRFELESPVAPGLVYEYEFGTQQLTMVSGGVHGGGSEQAPVTAAKQHAARSFRKEKILVESSDGTRVPLSLFYKETTDPIESEILNQTQTVVLVGYGAYGEPMDLGYNPGWQPLLDRGVVVAFSHTRGGGDLGRAWYAQGRREHKVRGIEDYEACALYLRNRFGFDHHGSSSSSSSSKEGGRLSLIAKAFSAGGVVVGASVNRNPGLFDKVVLTNAFVDVSSTMCKAGLFLTEHEYDEFGNPTADPIAEARIRSYCPIYNLDPGVQSRQSSTQFLLIGTLDDSNVPYWNASLYFRKLLEGYTGETSFGGDITSAPTTDQQSNNDRVFLELQTEGGHHFSGQNRIEVLALENAFILKD